MTDMQTGVAQLMASPHSMLTVRQLALLFAVESEPGIGTAALAKTLGIGKPSITRNTDKLVRHGFIDRATPAHDSRTRMFTLTERGSELVGGLISRPRALAA